MVKPEKEKGKRLQGLTGRKCSNGPTRLGLGSWVGSGVGSQAGSVQAAAWRLGPLSSRPHRPAQRKKGSARFWQVDWACGLGNKAGSRQRRPINLLFHHFFMDRLVGPAEHRRPTSPSLLFLLFLHVLLSLTGRVRVAAPSPPPDERGLVVIGCGIWCGQVDPVRLCSCVCVCAHTRTRVLLAPP